MTTDLEITEWVDPDGTAHPFTPMNGVVAGRARGHGMPPVTRSEDFIPLRAGARLRNANYGPREYAVPVTFTDLGPAGIRGALRDWARRFNVLAGDGALRFTTATGDVRTLTCRYQDGFGLDANQGSLLLGLQQAVLVFRAADPFFYGVEETATVALEGATVPWFPIFPLVLASTDVVATLAFDNGGDVEAFPMWEIHGPGDGVLLENVTTGASLELTTILAAGDVVEIDAREGAKTVRLQADHTNLYGDLTVASDLWALAPGVNTVRVTMPGADADSRVVATWQRRYLTL